MRLDILSSQLKTFICDDLLQPLDWQELDEMVACWLERHEQPMHIRTDLMPCLTCVAAGGTQKAALPVAAFWTLYFFAAKLFDNVQDNENQQLPWLKEGIAPAISYGLGAISAGNNALARLSDSRIMAEIVQAFGRTWGLAAKSQNENQNIISLDDYFANIIASTAQPLSTAAWAGARVAGSDTVEGKKFADYGLWAGIYQAIRSDCRGLQADINRGVYKLPVILALEQKDHPHYADLSRLLQTPSDDGQWIQKVMVFLRDMQAVERALMAAEIYKEQALATLAVLPSSRKEHLIAYIS